MADGPIDEGAVREALAKFQDPETGRSITQLEQVHQLSLEDDNISITLGLTTWSAPLWEATRQGNDVKLRNVLGVRFVPLTGEH